MEEDFCEIDFTTATSWEIFTARLEEIFYSWNLCQPSTEFSTENCIPFPSEYGVWLFKSEAIELNGKEFEILFCHKEVNQLNQIKNVNKEGTENLLSSDKCSEDCISLDTNNCSFKNITKFGFIERILKLIRLYNLQDFVLLLPHNSNASKLSETCIKVIMSSFCISAYNTRCFVPIFMQIYESWQNCFIGVCIDDEGFRIDYQMIHLGKIPSKFQYFSGLLALFKSKINPVSLTNYVYASVKFSYCVSEFENFSWPQVKSTNPGELSFGVLCEPINELRLHVAWPKVFENMILDNENHSGFDPFLAPNWSLQVEWKETHQLLGKHILQFIQVCQSSTWMNELISDLINRKNFTAGDLPVPSGLSVSKIITGGNASGNGSSNSNEMKRSKRFLSENTLISMLYYLFPDADTDNTHPYKLHTLEGDKENVLLKGMKTCSVGELPWRLSVIMCIIVHSYGEYAAAQFWFEFVQELRFRWEKCLKILGVQKGIPNHKTSLLNQKLQMLNSCIQKKIKRENIDASSEDSDDANTGAPTKYDSEEEEFFDCQTESKDEINIKIGRSLWNQPEGRLRKFNNLRLIETGEYMYIPVTQEMTPKTEDQLEDDAIVLMKLGSDSQGSKLRARMMCASLYSDMESFKAANPGAILEDFIRWYSPRDWIESSELDKYGQKKGKLSNRMLLPGNMWKEVWDNSLPVSASRQKCLFDDNTEAEKVLNFFQSRKHFTDVFSLLLPTLLHAALHVIICDENVIIIRRYFPLLDDAINVLIQKAVSATRNINVDISQYKNIADEISRIEDVVMRYKSLEYKLFPSELSQTDDEREILMKLVSNEKEMIIPGGPKSKLGQRITFLFTKELQEISSSVNSEEKSKNSNDNSSGNSLHTTDLTNITTSRCANDNEWYAITVPPYQKEFALRVSSSLPSTSSRSSEHSLIAHICSNEIFLASSFSRDSIFI